MKYIFLNIVIFWVCALSNVIHAQDTLSYPKWWFNSEIGGGYFSDKLKTFSMGYDYNHVVSRNKNIYAQLGGEFSIYRIFAIIGPQGLLYSINLCAGKVFINKNHFSASGFIGPNYGAYIYGDEHTIRSNELGISISAQFIVCSGRSIITNGSAGIGIALSANINKEMTVYALRIIFTGIKFKHK